MEFPAFTQAYDRDDGVEYFGIAKEGADVWRKAWSIYQKKHISANAWIILFPINSDGFGSKESSFAWDEIRKYEYAPLGVECQA